MCDKIIAASITILFLGRPGGETSAAQQQGGPGDEQGAPHAQPHLLPQQHIPGAQGPDPRDTARPHQHQHQFEMTNTLSRIEILFLLGREIKKLSTGCHIISLQDQRGRSRLLVRRPPGHLLAELCHMHPVLRSEERVVRVSQVVLASVAPNAEIR